MMIYELAHDTIARQVFAKAGAEARARRKVERYIHERYVAWQQRGAAMTQDDVDYVGPYLGVVRNPEEEIAFVQKSKVQLLRQRRRRQIILGLTAAVFAVLALLALWQSEKAKERERESRSMRVSLAASYALRDGDPVLAYRLAQQTLAWANDENAEQIARDVLLEIKANPLVCNITHQDSIVALEFGGDGSFFLSASRDGEIRISDLRRKVLARQGVTGGIRWAAFMPGDKTVMVLADSGKLLHWDLARGTLNSIRSELNFTQARLSVDRTYLLAAAQEQVRVWSTNNLNRVFLSLSHAAPISSMASVPGLPPSFITADEAGQIYGWNAQGERTLSYRNYLGLPVTGMAVNQAGDRVVFRTTAGDFLQSTAGDSLTAQTELLFQAYQPTRTTFSGTDDPQRMVSISRDSNLVYVWNLSWVNNDIDMQWSPKGQAQFAVITPDSARVLVASTDNEMVFYALKGNKLEQNQEVFRFYNQTLWGVFAPNEVHFLSSAGGHSALLWKLDPQYVANKRALDMDKLQRYYDQRLTPLTAGQRALYQLD